MNAIRRIRSELQLTQAEFGEAIGVSQGSVHFYESGAQVPPERAKRVVELARARGVVASLDEIYGLRESRTKGAPKARATAKES